MSSDGELIYLASPFSHPNTEIQDHRFQLVLEATALLLKSGHFVYSPIVHNYYVAGQFNLPSDFVWWAKFDLFMISRCDTLAVLTLPGWKESVGVQAEIKYAQQEGKVIVYLDLEELRGGK